MKIFVLWFFTLMIFSSYIFCQMTDTSFAENKQIRNLPNGNSENLHSILLSEPIINFLIKKKNVPDLLSFNNHNSLGLTKFYFMDEISESSKPASEEKDEKQSSKYDWLYFAGTAIAAVIVYFAWPEKTPEAKQSLTFGKPLPPR
jgi:hypothetical protein